MLSGSLPETVDATIRNPNVTANSFKEFLRFMYRGNVELTMDNIESVLDLADCSLCTEIFTECEHFLIEELNGDNVIFVYGLVLLHDRATRLKVICEEEMSINAGRLFRSNNYQDIEYDFLEQILQCDTLAYEEKDIFIACINWARAKCRQNEIDEFDPLNLRACLGKIIYQFRFSSMSSEDIAICIDSCPGLFSEEIICMTAMYRNYSGVKRFNWTPRYFNLLFNEN